MASFSPKLPSSPSSELAASFSSCSSSSSSFYSLRCANVPGKMLIHSPAPRLCHLARCPIPSSPGARLARSPVTSSFHCGQRTTTALTMRRWAATMATQSTLSRRCPHRAQPTSTTKFNTLHNQQEKKKRSAWFTFMGRNTFRFGTWCFLKPVLFLPPAAQIWRDVHWAVTSTAVGWLLRVLFCFDCQTPSSLTLLSPPFLYHSTL